MNKILCLTKPQKFGVADKVIHLYPTPTQDTLYIADYISDRWRVFDTYRTYVETCNGFEGDSEHLDEVREALLGGFVWSVI